MFWGRGGGEVLVAICCVERHEGSTCADKNLRGIQNLDREWSLPSIHDRGLRILSDIGRYRSEQT